MFLERGQTELAEQQVKGHPEILEEIETEAVDPKEEKRKYERKK